MTDRRASRLLLPLLTALLVVPIGALLVSAYRNRPGAAVIAVHPDEHHQLIHGWEAVAQASLLELEPYPNRQEVVDELLDKAVDLGLTRLRVGIGSSAENTRDFGAELRAGRITREEEKCGRYSTANDNADPHVLNPDGFIWSDLDREMRGSVLSLARRLEARGEKLWVNVQYTAFTSQICRGYAYHHDEPEEYAEFALAVFLHLRDTFGIVPDSWELMLEPDNTTIWTGERLAAAAAATATRLQTAGFTPAFIGPATTAGSHALPYLEPYWRSAALRPFLKEISYHRDYGVESAVIAAIGAASRERGVASAMLEMIGAGPDDLYEDLTLGNVSAWQQFALSWPAGDTGAHYFMIDATRPAGQRATLSSTGWYLRQYFRAFRPGARVVGVATDHDDFRPVAALNADDRMAVVVRARRAGQLTITGLAAGMYTTSCWTDQARWNRATDPCAGALEVEAAGTAVVTMPDAGVFSLTRTPHAAP